ncbi:MAG TPA: two-component sensor histidine kinase [Desulfosporosinus sp.]|nr:two-component sensor histidine kinase [Desulfosporosinus sp.]
MVNVVTEHSRKENSLLEAKSHEIRTYMTRIISMTDLTLMTEVTEEQRDYLTTVKSSTKLLLKVLTDIMDYSKIQAGKVDLEQRPFDIRQIVDEVIDLFNTAAQQKNIEIRLKDFNNEIPKNVIGDSLRIKQVLSNLVGNSVRFTNQGGVAIEVDLEELNERWMQIRFIVSDTGIGIPEDKLSKLIKGFREADSLIKEFGGTGLIITKKLVRLMDGELYVDSREGIGSKFYFTAVFGV